MRLSRVAVPEGSSSHQEGRERAELFFFFNIYLHLLIYLAVPGLSCSRRDLQSSLQHADLPLWCADPQSLLAESSSLTRDRTLYCEHGVLATKPLGSPWAECLIVDFISRAKKEKLYLS